MSKCIIFDLDGTLVTLPIRYDLIQKKLRELFDLEVNFSPLIPSIIEYSKNNEKLIRGAFELLCEEELIASESVKEIDGLQLVIDYLLSKKYSISLITMQCKKSTNVILKKLNLTTKFSSIITRDENHDRFFQIKNTYESLNFSPSDVTVIGDRLHDINSATRANCNSILVNRSDMPRSSHKKIVLKELTGIL